MRLDGQHDHTTAEAASAHQTERREITRAQIRDDEKGHEEHERGAEVILERQAAAAHAGKTDEHPQVALVEQTVERRRTGENVADLGDLRGLERQRAEAQPCLRAALARTDEQRDGEQADRRRAHEPADLLRARQVAQEKAENEEHRHAHQNRDELLGQLVRNGRARHRERQRTQEERDGLHLEADAAEQAHEDEIAPADAGEHEEGQRNGDVRLAAACNHELHGCEHLKQRQQHQTAPHAGRTALLAALGHLPALFLSGNRHHRGRDAAERDRIAVLDDRVFVYRQIVDLDAALGIQVVYRPAAVVFTDKRGVLPRDRRIFELHIAGRSAADDVFPVRERQAHTVAEREIAPDLVRMLDLPQRADRAHQDHQREQREHEANDRRVPRAHERIFRKKTRQHVKRVLQRIFHNISSSQNGAHSKPFYFVIIPQRH